MKKYLVWGLALTCGLWNLGNPGSTHAQAIFQNNDTSCEEHALSSFLVDSEIPAQQVAVTCGRFNDDSSVIDPTHGGNPDFPDCATQADFTAELDDIPYFTNNVLTNTAAHGDNCINAGQANFQFESPEILGLEDFPGTRMGTIAHGNLNNGEFDDLAMVEAGVLFDTTSSRSLGFLLSQAGGGFGSPTMASGVALLEPALPVPYQTFPINLILGAQNEAITAQRSLVLFDCDGDGVDEAVVTVKDANDSTVVGLMVVQNNGSGLIDSPAPAFIPLPAMGIMFDDDNLSIPLVQGDFNGDGVSDLIAAISDFNVATPFRSAALCLGNGACGFDCPVSGDANELAFSGAAGWLSAASGDFNGDGLQDAVLPELTSLSGSPAGQLRYLLNSGGDLDTWGQVVLPLTLPGFDLGAAFVITTGRFSTTAVQNGIDEVAGNSGNIMGSTDSINVTVVTTDGMGSFATPRLLSFDTLPPGPLPFGGIDSGDLDHCGGDDIISLVPGLDIVMTGAILSSQASVFLNENEAPVVTIGAGVPTELLINTTIDIPTTCGDPTFDERNFLWTVVGQPAGSNVTLGTPSGTVTGLDDDVSTTFEADLVGSYTIQIDCTDFCGLSDVEQITFNLTFPLTQGSNLFNCSMGPMLGSSQGSHLWTLILLWTGPLFTLALRRRR